MGEGAIRDHVRATGARVLAGAAVVAALLVSAAGGTARAEGFGDKIRINGYFSLEFEKMLGDEGKGDPNGSFDADQVDLVVNALPADNLRLALDLGYVHGTNTEEGEGGVVVEYAFAEYSFSDALRIRGGKVQTPFGIYNEIHNAKPLMLTVKEPNATVKNDRFGSEYRFFPRFNTGIAALGAFAGGDVDYVLLLANGGSLGANTNEEDDNEAKAIAARVRWSPLDNLELGASFYTDTLTEYDDEGEATDGETDVLSYGAFAKYAIGNLGLELEGVAGSYDPSGADTVSRYGLTAMAFYHLGRFTPYFRYEYLEPDTDTDDDTASQFIYGVNVRVAEGLFLKAEFDTFASGDANARFEGQGYTEFKAAVAMGF